MKVSKSRFFNYIRCDRFTALEEIHRKKEDALVTFDPDDIESIYAEETLEKKRFLIESMYERDDEDEDTEIDLITVEFDSPYMDDFYKIEEIAGKVLSKKYQASLISGREIYDQKHFEAYFNDYKFHCFLDAYLENDQEIIVAEVKSGTDSSFLKMGGQDSLFIKSPDGVYFRAQDLGLKSKAKTDSLFNPFDKKGRKVFDLSFQRFVIELWQKENQVFNKPVRYLLVMLNSNYVYDGKLDSYGQPVYSDDIISIFDLTKMTEELYPLIENYANKVVRRLNDNDISLVPLGKFCQRKQIRQCPYFEICKSEKKIPDLNSLYAYSMGHFGFEIDNEKYQREELFEKDIVHMLDIDEIDLTRPRQILQRKVVAEKFEYIDKVNVLKGLKMLKYPLYHLDFETYAPPLPRFKGETCYVQSVFQYSLHIEREPGVCDEDRDHYEYLAKNNEVDEREKLLLSLIENIDDPNGMILAYNVGFEKGVLRNLFKVFPEHTGVLSQLTEEAFDLMYLLKGSKKLFPNTPNEYSYLYYHPKLNGSFSIKSVLPVIAPELTYENLNVKKGTDAVDQFAKLINMEKPKYEQTYQDLLAYCKRDTWAMVVILDNLRTKTS